VPGATAIRARTAVAVVFGVNGFAMAAWASRLPAIRDDLHLSTEHLGLILLALSGGSVAMLPWAGTLVRAFGPARTVLVASAVALSGITLVGLAGRLWILGLGLALTGAGVGAWDVSMNVEGAEVERRVGRAIMPRFHGAFSLGTVFGAGVGALAAGFDVPVRVQLPVVAGLVLALVVFFVRDFLPAAPATEPGPAAAVKSAISSQVSSWLEPSTLLIGVLVFSMALAEGSANDWLALAVVDGYGAVHAVGALVFGVFVTGMTAMRMAGPYLLGRFDHVLVLRSSAGLVLLGTGLVIVGAIWADGHGSPAQFVLAPLGALCWGAGAALGFPMGMTAAATDPARAASRVGVVSTIGYTAFLAGPPLLGTLGQHLGIAQSLVAVSGAVLLSLVTAGAVRQPAVPPPAVPQP
jgi:MFS family permease